MTSRLRRPVPPADVLTRSRLFTFLDTAMEADTVVLVAGGAGSGKTVLLSSWLAARPLRAAWVNLNKSDSDAHQLAGDLLTAFQCACKGTPASEHLMGLRAPPGFLDPERFADALIEALGKMALVEPLVLVVDDLQEVAGSRQALALLDQLLLWCPASVRIVLAARADPPLALGRLLVDGRLKALRQNDLAFTSDESVAFLTRACRSVDVKQALEVHDITSGWPVGLRLAALSLRGTSNPALSVAGFSAQDRALAEYLVGEVLDKLPAHLRAFVLHATVDDEVCAGLTDAATGEVNGAAMLAECEQQNLFLTAIREVDRCRWYQWHHLFAAHMRRRALFEDPESARRDEIAAARFWRPLDPLRSAGHSIAGGDTQAAEELIAESWVALSLRGGVRSILATADRFSPAGRYSAEFHLAHSTARVQVREVDGAREALRRAHSAASLLPARDRRRFEVRGAALRLFLLDDQDQTWEDMMQTSRLLLRDLDHGGWVPDLATVALAQLAMGMVEARFQEDKVAAVGLLRRACAVAREADLPLLDLLARSELCSPLIASGDLSAVEKDARLVLTQAAERGWDALPIAAPRAYLGWLAYWRDEQDAARAHLDAARAVLLDSDSSLDGLVTYFHTLTCLAIGDVGAARDNLIHAQQLSEIGTPPPYWGSLHASIQAHLSVADGDVNEALRIASSPDPVRAHWLATCTRAELLRRTGSPVRSFAALSSLKDEELYPTTAAVVGVLRCLALVDLDQPVEAHHCLEDALSAAAPAGLVRPFTSHRAALARVLSHHLETGTAHPVFVARLLEQMGGLVNQTSGGYDERLTPKELCILFYLRTPMSTAEIAEERFVSVNTVKTHLAKIYSKLHVGGRREAVRRAHELGLFDTELAVELPAAASAAG